MSVFEQQWRARFERFAARQTEDHRVSGWSAVGLRRRLALFEALLDGGLLTPGARVLELGCGAGTYVRLLAKRGHPVVGLDYSLPSLARAAAADTGGAGHYTAGEAYALPFADGSFRGLVCIGVFQALARPGTALAEMVRVLEPGGRLLVETLNPWNPLAMARRGRCRMLREPSRLRYEDPAALERTLASAGGRPLRRLGVLLPPRGIPGMADWLGRPWVSSVLDAVPGLARVAPHAFWVLGEKP